MSTVTRLMEKALFVFAKQWIAGNTIDDAIQSAKFSYNHKMKAIINKLGEYQTSQKKIDATVIEYKKILSSLRRSGIEGGISVKPTQIGLAKSQKLFFQNMSQLIKSASPSHAFVWIDMESSDHTDKTLEIYYKLFSRYERLGIALQANLKRTQHDLIDLIEQGAKIRLVKGAYKEKKNIAFQSKKSVDKNYLKLMSLLFRKGNEFGIASHDEQIIQKAIDFSKKYVRKFEFQMLKGIRNKTKTELIKKGFEVSEYIPYGTNWLPYSIRRLKERKRNILLLGSSFIHSQRV